MLALLLNVPKDDSEWSQWSFAHRDSHDKIRKAILLQSGANLTDYQVDPMTRDDMARFLQNNSQLHDDMNAILKLPGIDLTDANLSDERELRTWIDYHYQEHLNVEQALGI